jgi:hypothetical protein
MIAEAIGRLDALYYEDYQFDIEHVTRTVTAPCCRRGYLLDEFKNEIIGLWSIFSFGEEFYKKTLSGAFEEQDFKKNLLTLPPFKGEIYLLIGTLILHEEYRSMKNFKVLMATMLESLVQLVQTGCIINGLATFGYTDIGKKLCEGFGFNTKVMDKHLGVVYEVDFTKKDIPDIAKPIYELIKKNKLKKIQNELESFDEESGLPIVKDILKKWGYKVDGIFLDRINFLKPLQAIIDLMQNYSGSWYFAGGWGVDLNIGHQTREHQDVEIAIPRSDQMLIRDYLPTETQWFYAKDSELHLWNEDVALKLPVHEIHATLLSGMKIEILLNEFSSGEWIYRRNFEVKRSLDFFSQDAPPRLPAEVLLLYKAQHGREKDQQDFKSLLPLMNSEQKDWLKQSLLKAHPEHEWIKQII